MKFGSLLAVASLAAGAFAQSITIGYPPRGKLIKAGHPLTVQVNRPDTLTGSQEVAIVISLVPCPHGRCPKPSNVLGPTLYAGPYHPEFPSTPTSQHVPQQNFTVTIPDSFKPNSTAQLTVAHLSLVGAGPFALFEYKNVTLRVQ
ncbi:hypothetical protein BJV78DRAFT_1152841 [Lactifluus subvellereus]|nr:hypothetical protein BJV78DRAFT_1152841 [Lactifluus subvellereus]